MFLQITGGARPSKPVAFVLFAPFAGEQSAQLGQHRFYQQVQVVVHMPP
jgi:hypothetical protein